MSVKQKLVFICKYAVSLKRDTGSYSSFITTSEFAQFPWLSGIFLQQNFALLYTKFEIRDLSSAITNSPKWLHKLNLSPHSL